MRSARIAVPTLILALSPLLSGLAAPGSLDPTFGGTGKVITDAGDYFDSAYALALQSDGKIVVTGSSGGGAALVRYNSNGTLDVSFNGTGRVTNISGFDEGHGVVVQSNGRIVVGGVLGDSFGVARFNSNGTTDASFGINGVMTTAFPGGAFPFCHGLAVQSDGKIVLAGSFSNGVPGIQLVRYTSSGLLDTSFGNSGVLATGIVTSYFSTSYGGVVRIAIQSDGKILVTGGESNGSNLDIVLARYNSNGTPDMTFNGTGKVRTDVSSDDTGFDVAVQRDGKIVVGGWTDANFQVSPRQGSFAIVRYNTNGSLDSTFNGTGKATVDFSSFDTDAGFSIAIQPNGKIVVVGVNDLQISDGKLAFARFTDTGLLDSTFAILGKGTVDFGGWSHDHGFDTVLQSDGKIVIGGTVPSLVNGFDFGVVRLEGDPPAPEIFVEQPVGTSLVDGASSVDLGNVAAGSNASKTFTIRNIGNLAMSGVAVTIAGADAADYSVTTAPSASLPAFTGSTTFTVRFAPTVAGAKSAALHIASDDPDEAPFDVSLTGTGLCLLAIGGSQFTVREEDGVLQLPLVRSAGSFGAATVNVSTTNGTATAPSDLTALTNQTVTFGDGVSNIDVPITIQNPGSTPEGNETFTVTLSSPGTGAALGTPVTATVQILDSVDTTKPGTPVFTAPGAGVFVGVDVGGTVTVSGTAADNQQVSAVELSLNGAPFAPAAITLTGSGAAYGTTATFTAALMPITGANTVVARAVDLRGNVSAVQGSRTFTSQRGLVVFVDGSLGSVTAGFAGITYREAGKALTIMATPKPPTTSPVFAGALFTGWTLGGQDLAMGNAAFTPQRLGMAASALEKQAITFIFREGLQLTANFVINPFAPLAGAYNGLIRPNASLPDRAPAGAGAEDGTTRTNATEGRFSATVQNTGAFSGTMTIDGLALNVAGAFDSNGDARFGTARVLTQTVARTNKPSLIVALHLDMVTPGVNDKITGMVTATDFKKSVVVAVSDVECDRAFYNGTTQIVPAAYLGAANANGMFTTVYPAKAVGNQTVGFTAKDYPQGDGVGTITVTKAGVITVAGTLADGTALSASSALSQANTFPLFAQLYSKLGFLSGFVQLDNTQTESDMAAVDLQWLRPFQNTSHYYPHGWSEVIKVDLVGAKYAVVAGQSVLKAANGANIQAADADGNAVLTLSDGKLSETLVKSANLSAADVATKVPDNDPTFTMVVNRATGAMTGTLNHTDDTVPNYNAIIFQKGANAGAYGYFLTKQPVPIDYTGESGGVMVIGAP